MQENKMFESPSRTRAIAEGLGTGVLKALDDFLGAKLLAKQARNEREARIAKANLENKKLALDERRVAYQELVAGYQVNKLEFEKEQQERNNILQGNLQEDLDDIDKLYDMLETEEDPGRAEAIKKRIQNTRRRALATGNRIKTPLTSLQAEAEDERKPALSTNATAKVQEYQFFSKIIENDKDLSDEERQRDLELLKNKYIGGEETELPRKVKEYLEFKKLVEDDPKQLAALNEQYLGEDPDKKKEEETEPDIIEITSGIADEAIRQTTTRFTGRAIFTGDKGEKWAKQIENEMDLGNRKVVLKMFTDKIADIEKTTDKFVTGRLQIAKQLTNIRHGFSELNDMGVSTGKILNEYIEGMTRGEWSQKLKKEVIEITGLEDLNPEQERKAVALATQVNTSLALLLQKVSGAAVHESEFERWRAMLPALFKSSIVNIGTIDGFITALRGDQEEVYTRHTTAELAAEMMTNEGWGAIKTAENYHKETADRHELWQSKSDSDKYAYAARAIDQTQDRESAIRQFKFFGLSQAKAKQLIDAFDNLSPEEQEKARKRAEELLNE